LVAKVKGQGRKTKWGGIARRHWLSAAKAELKAPNLSVFKIFSLASQIQCGLRLVINMAHLSQPD
jgi:hypothetical protein